MAKSSDTNGGHKISKSEAIRRALKSSSGSPSEVSSLLAEQGIDVSAAYVSTVKASDKRRAGTTPRKPGRPARKRDSIRDVTPIAISDTQLQSASEVILLAVELVLRVGGANARDLIDRAEEMVTRFQQAE